jgi:glycosyltransferase involved in cell wall biosynthesis
VRIARIITRLNVGGPSIQAITLAERLNDRGFETLLVHGQLGTGEGDMRYLLSDPRVTISYVPSLRRPIAPLHEPIAFAAVYRLLCRFKPAIVHTHMAKAGTIGRLAAALYNRTVGRGQPARILHTYHGHVLEGYFSPRTAQVFIATERKLARLSDAIVAIAPRVRDELVRQYRIGRLDQYHVVPLGFDLSAFAAIDDAARVRARDSLAIPEHAPVVTTVGRLTAIKQHDLLLEAAALIASRHPTAVFLIAGDGELRASLERLAADRGIANRVRFLGWRRDLTTIYAGTDVFLLTSRNEGTPVALIESLASGVPGVSTNVGGVADVIVSDDIGLLAPFGDAPALADSVHQLLADPARRRAMGARGRAHVLARYTLDRLVADIDDLYRSLLLPEHTPHVVTASASRR